MYLPIQHREPYNSVRSRSPPNNIYCLFSVSAVNTFSVFKSRGQR